jgi:hypothetical protein
MQYNTPHRVNTSRCRTLGTRQPLAANAENPHRCARSSPHTHPLLGAASTAHGCKPTKARDTVFDKTDRYEGPFHTVPTTKQTVECHSTRQKTDGPHDETDAATVAQLAASWRTTGRRSKTTAPCSRTRSTALA